MEPKTNKVLLVFLFFGSVLFNPAQAICVPRNQSLSEASSLSPPTSNSPPSPSPTPKSQPPPSPPSPSTTPATAPPTPPSHPPPSPPPPSSTGSAPVPASPPKSKPPPSPPPPSTSSAPVPPTEERETPSFLNAMPKFSVSLPTLSLDVGLGGKKVSDPQIKSLCGKTDHADLCLQLIAPFFNGESDIPSVVEMLIKAGTEQTKKAIATAEKMSTDPKYSDPKAVSKFKDCKEIYDDALDNLQEASDAIADKDIGTILTMISATISDFSTCDDGFTGQPNPIPDGVSPMAEINQNLMNISDIILVLANMIH